MTTTRQSDSHIDTTHQVSTAAPGMRSFAWRLIASVIPPPLPNLTIPAGVNPSFIQSREQILTGLMWVGAILGALNASLAAPGLLQRLYYHVLLIDVAIIVLLLFLAFCRQLDYRIRAGLFLAGLYIVASTELLNFGYTDNVISFFIVFSVFALLFFTTEAGIVALVLSMASLLLVGLAMNIWQFTPFLVNRRASMMGVITTAAVFLMIVGTVQLAIATLIHHLNLAWQRENQARTALEVERDLLEQRVAERTCELAAAHAYEAGQKAYMEALFQTSLDLINRREVADLLQAIVERAAAILDAPCSELMLFEEDCLVVHAFTANQPFLRGDRAQRGEGLLSWQAYDTHQPVIIEDYSTWPDRRAIYDRAAFHAVANFPILIGQHCLGVLAVARTEPGHPFTPEDAQKGLAFSHIAALALDSAQLYATALRQIAERRQAEEALQRYAEELQAQNAELNAFAHTVAHDLKNPLATLMGYNNLLQVGRHRMHPEEISEVLNNMGRTGYKMTAIIEELLLLASVRTQDAVPLGRLAMGEIVAELDTRLNELLKAYQATIVKPDTWPAAMGYAPWVEEVWVNYVSNAIKYGGRPPLITIGASPTASGWIRFWVQDNGQGISNEQRALLFTPFTRLHTSRVEGHGLGLSIVQRIVNRLGGEVGIESVPGQGSRFYFTLPSAEGHE